MDGGLSGADGPAAVPCASLCHYVYGVWGRMGRLLDRSCVRSVPVGVAFVKDGRAGRYSQVAHAPPKPFMRLAARSALTKLGLGRGCMYDVFVRLCATAAIKEGGLEPVGRLSCRGVIVRLWR